MELAYREYLTAKIIAGATRCKLIDPLTNQYKPFLLKQPDRIKRLAAQEVYQEVLREGQLEGLLTDEQIIDRLIDEELWSVAEEDILKQLEKDFDELKVQLFQNFSKKDESRLIREMLNKAKSEYLRLTCKKNMHGYASITGVASLCRAKYIVAAGLCYDNGDLVWKDEIFWDVPNRLLDEAVELYFNNKPTEKEYRELIRTDPWRAIWACRKAEGQLFGIAPVDLTEEQKSLLTWSGVYDNILEHPECPTSLVIEDDDAIDGWMIFQKRKREREQKEQQTDNQIGNDKIRNSEEIYLMAKNVEEVRNIESLNDDASRQIKRKRFNLIKQKGVVDETEMPDSQLKIREQWNRQYVQAMKG